MRAYPFLSALLIACCLILLTLQGATLYLSDYYVDTGFPWPWSSWRWVFLHAPPTIPFFIWFALQGIGVMLSALAFALSFKRLRRNKPTLDMHGSARFSTEEELDKMGMFNGHGVFVGAIQEKKETRYLRHDGPEHLLMIAPTRSGKGVSIVIPTLLTWPASSFIVDIKGELWALTAGWRSKDARQRCLRLDLTDPNGPRFNPLDTVTVGTPGEIGDIQNLVTLLVDPLGKGLDGPDGHWRKAAHALLTGIVCFAIHVADRDKRTATLADVAELLAPADHPFSKVLAAMMNFPSLEPSDQAAVELIRSAARQQAVRVGEEAASVLSTTANYLALYRDPVLARVTSGSDFTAESLMNGESNTSVYFVVNPADKARLQPVTRLIISTIVRRLTIGMQYENGKAVSGHSRRLLLMLDEFAALGPLEVISETIAYMASFGIKAMLIVQDYSQLWSLYTRDEKLSGNCHLQLAFAPNRVDTAEKLSSMTGTKTMIKQEKLHQTSISLMSPHDDRFSEVSRPLMTADEIMRLSPAQKDGDDIVAPGQMLIFVGGSHPVLGVQPLYFLDPILAGRSQVAPPAQPDLLNVPPRIFTPGSPSPLALQLLVNAVPVSASALASGQTSLHRERADGREQTPDDEDAIAGGTGDVDADLFAVDDDMPREVNEATSVAIDTSIIDSGRGGRR